MSAVSRITSASGSAILDAPQDVEPVAVRQLVVEQHEVDALLEAVERFGGGFGFEHPIALIAEPAGQGPSNQLFIVDDEHRGAHVPHEYTDSDRRTPGKENRTLAHGAGTPLAVVLVGRAIRPGESKEFV